MRVLVDAARANDERATELLLTSSMRMVSPWRRRLCWCAVWLALVAVLTALYATAPRAEEGDPPVPALKPLWFKTFELPCNHTGLVLNGIAAYREQPAGIGMSGPRLMVQIFVSPDTGTYTVAMSSADGETCILAAGDRWEIVPVIPTSAPAL